ncbi:MAG TPA: exo-alpha-sialidase [Desulfomonilia bacterium]
MTDSNHNRLNIIIRVLIFILSVLFAAVVYVWITSFGGEFLIIARRTWILAIFAVMLVAGSSFGLLRAMQKKEHPSPFVIRTVFAFMNLISGIILFVIFGYLLLWVVDSMDTVELAVLSLPFIGFGLLLIIDGAIALFCLKKGGGGVPGMVISGCAFLFLFAAFGITLLLWNPAYAPNMEHTWLFKKGMPEGRGYRIPSMLTMKDDLGRDIVIAFAESRADVMLDWGDIDLVMRRSVDGGKTWGSIQVLVDAGGHTAGNPCPVFDRDTRTLWLPYCIDNKEVWMMKSTDFGKTFSKPFQITKELGLELKCDSSPLCMEYGTGPGTGIQLNNSRLVVPAYFFGPSIKRGAHVIYSDDHGKTWHKGKDLGIGEEPQAFVMADGTLNMNCRYKRCQPRQVGLSRDGGKTWFKQYPDNALIDAETQASIISLPGTSGNIIFSNPAGCARGNMTLRMSLDDGVTWPFSREVYNGPSCYSQLCTLPDGEVLLLFETGKYDYREGLMLVRFPPGWLREVLRK